MKGKKVRISDTESVANMPDGEKNTFRGEGGLRLIRRMLAFIGRRKATQLHPRKGSVRGLPQPGLFFTAGSSHAFGRDPVTHEIRSSPGCEPP